MRVVVARVMVVAVVLVGCGSGSDDTPSVSDVVGVWNVTDGSGDPVSQMTFTDDGEYLIGDDGSVDSGTFELSGSSLVLTSTSDSFCSEGDRGEYELLVGDGAWTLAPIEDECAYRPSGGPFTFSP